MAVFGYTCTCELITQLKPKQQEIEQYSLIIRGVKAIKGMFGSDSSKNTNFGTEVDNAIGFTFLPCAKTDTRWGRLF